MQSEAQILVVDDTPANLEIITDILAAAGYQVAMSVSGERALKLLQTYRPDLILLDVQMPVIDGFETCSQIKANPDLASIPIIFITALSDADSVVRGFSLGAVDYINKPFREPELLARVKTHLQVKQLTEKLEQQVLERTQSLELAMAELASSQVQLVQREKMSALGNLVAGVAHEINNPIGFIRGNTKELKRSLQEVLSYVDLCRQSASSQETEAYAEEIELDFLVEDIPKMLRSTMVGCDRIRDISASLRVFSRQDQDVPTLHNIHEGLESTLLILRHRLKSNDSRPEIKVIKDFGDLPYVSCFPGQLNQVFMNILANAIDELEECMQERAAAELTENYNQILIRTTASDSQVHIHIQDNGRGMPKEVKEKIFDRFYTTKSVQKGTGLGLAISHQIVVEKHHGCITVKSECGIGTEFILSLSIASGVGKD